MQSTRTCSGCQNDQTRPKYSGRQWKLGARRLCTACIDLKEARRDLNLSEGAAEMDEVAELAGTNATELAELSKKSQKELQVLLADGSCKHKLVDGMRDIVQRDRIRNNGRTKSSSCCVRPKSHVEWAKWPECQVCLHKHLPEHSEHHSVIRL